VLWTPWHLSAPVLSASHIQHTYSGCRPTSTPCWLALEEVGQLPCSLEAELEVSLGVEDLSYHTGTEDLSYYTEMEGWSHHKVTGDWMYYTGCED